MAKNTDEKTPTTEKEEESAQDYGQFEEDVVERPFRRRKTTSLNRRDSLEPGWPDGRKSFSPKRSPFQSMTSMAVF